MKVKLLLVFFVMNTFISLYAQESKNNCNFEFTVNAEKNSEGLEYEDRFVNFKWDIFKISLNDEISIEIIKIFDCFNDIKGTQTESYAILNLKSKDLLDKKSFKIMHTDMIAKCFKWRVVLKSDNCHEQTDWNYYSFLD